MAATKGSEKLSRVVKFAQTAADQQLVQAIEQALEQQRYDNFSDLCKQALQQLLFSSVPSPSLSSPSLPPNPELKELRQQVQTLQMQVAQLSGAVSMHQTLSLSKLEQQMQEQMQQMQARLTQVEARIDTSPPAPPNIQLEEPDPLLARLAPLLEDF